MFYLLRNYWIKWDFVVGLWIHWWFKKSNKHRNWLLLFWTCTNNLATANWRWCELTTYRRCSYTHVHYILYVGSINGCVYVLFTFNNMLLTQVFLHDKRVWLVCSTLKLLEINLCHGFGSWMHFLSFVQDFKANFSAIFG